MADFISDFFNIPACFLGTPTADILKDWVGKTPKSSPLFLLPFNMMWIVWKARNLAVFEGKKRNIHGIIQQILSTVQVPFLGAVYKKGRSRHIGNPPVKFFPCGFIDGASNNMIAGAGLCIFLNDSHFLEFSLGVSMALIPKRSCSASGHSCTSPK